MSTVILCSTRAIARALSLSRGVLKSFAERHELRFQCLVVDIEISQTTIDHEPRNALCPFLHESVAFNFSGGNERVEIGNGFLAALSFCIWRHGIKH